MRTEWTILWSYGTAAAYHISPDASYEVLSTTGEAIQSIFKSQTRVESLKASHDTDWSPDPALLRLSPGPLRAVSPEELLHYHVWLLLFLKQEVPSQV